MVEWEKGDQSSPEEKGLKFSVEVIYMVMASGEYEGTEPPPLGWNRNTK